MVLFLSSHSHSEKEKNLAKNIGVLLHGEARHVAACKVEWVEGSFVVFLQFYACCDLAKMNKSTLVKSFLPMFNVLSKPPEK